MAAPRVENTPSKQAMKAASKALVRAVGGVEAADAYCRAGFRRLSEYGAPENACFMPIDVVADLEAVAHGTAGYPHVTRTLAREAGYALVKLPSATMPSGEALYSALAASLTESGELHAGIASALSDGVVSREEAHTIHKLALDAAEEAMRLAVIAAHIREMQ